MTITCEQKTTTIEGKRIAYVETQIKDEKYSFRVLFDDKTKKRFNAFLTSKGFKIGVISDTEDVPTKIIEI